MLFVEYRLAAVYLLFSYPVRVLRFSYCFEPLVTLISLCALNFWYTGLVRLITCSQ